MKCLFVICVLLYWDLGKDSLLIILVQGNVVAIKSEKVRNNPRHKLILIKLMNET